MPTLRPTTAHHTASVPRSEDQQAAARSVQKPAPRIVHRPAPTNPVDDPSAPAATPVDIPLNGSVTEPPTLRLTSGRPAASSGQSNVSVNRQRPGASPSSTVTAEPGADGNDSEDGEGDLTIPTSMKDLFDESGKIYSLMYACWVRTTNILRTRPNIDLSGMDRWENDITRADGITAEIIDFLPHELRPLIMTDKLAGRAFRNRVRTQRTQSVYNAKFGFERAIENVYPDSIRKAVIAKNFDDPEIVVLLKGKSESYHVQNPPLLYPPGKVGNVAYMYKNPLLTDLGKSMVYGRRALWSTQAHRNSTGMVLGLKNTLPGFIALVFQVARFLFTPDTKFAPTGDKTGIHYFKDLEWHRERLMSKEAKGGKSAEVVQELYRFWDKNVFGFANAPGAARTFTIDEDTEAELEWMNWGEGDEGETTAHSESHNSERVAEDAGDHRKALAEDQRDTGDVGDREDEEEDEGEDEEEDEEEGSQAVPDVIKGMEVLDIDDEPVEGAVTYSPARNSNTIVPPATTSTTARREEFARLSAALAAGFTDGLPIYTTIDGKRVQIVPTVSALSSDCPEEPTMLLSRTRVEKPQEHEVDTEGLPVLVDSSGSSEEDVPPPVDDHISHRIHNHTHTSAVIDKAPTLSLASGTGSSQPTVVVASTVDTSAQVPPRRKSPRTGASKKRK
ncbi:hypothetical protein EIP86_000380 [Pleurotus ostreatoroseus]|nr:hypothetical protein EIP86_000380 [Pleurotus ostreatoroseus]